MTGRPTFDTGSQANEVTYIVLNMDSDGSENKVSDRLLKTPGVDAVVVDLATKGVTVHGAALDVAALRTVIEDAGYQAA